jgi:hypothetical protein
MLLFHSIDGSHNEVVLLDSWEAQVKFLKGLPKARHALNPGICKLEAHHKNGASSRRFNQMCSKCSSMGPDAFWLYQVLTWGNHIRTIWGTKKRTGGREVVKRSQKRDHACSCEHSVFELSGQPTVEVAQKLINHAAVASDNSR